MYMTKQLRVKIEALIGREWHRSEWRCKFADDKLCLTSWGVNSENFEIACYKVFDGIFVTDLGAGGNILPEVYATSVSEWTLEELVRFLRQEHDLKQLVPMGM